MLDIPKLGLELLNGAIAHLARVEDDSQDFEDSVALLERCKGLVGRTELKMALTATSDGGVDYVKREKDVMHSLMETSQVMRMME